MESDVKTAVTSSTDVQIIIKKNHLVRLDEIYTLVFLEVDLDVFDLKCELFFFKLVLTSSNNVQINF